MSSNTPGPEQRTSNERLDWKSLETLYCDCTPKGSVHQGNCPLKGPYADEIERLTAWQAEWLVKYGVLNVENDRLRAALYRARASMHSATVFVTSRERIKRPEGEQWWRDELAAVDAVWNAGQPDETDACPRGVKGCACLTREARLHGAPDEPAGRHRRVDRRRSPRKL